MKLTEAVGLGGQDRQMICFVGAGGKSSLMLRLAQELAVTGYSVLVTTTTKMWASQLKATAFSPGLIVESDIDLLLSKLSEVNSTTRIVTTSAEITDDGKAVGLTADAVDRIFMGDLFDFILVEADGSRGKSLKVPEGNEPVLPKCCTMVVPVAGVDIIGRPLTGEYVHRHQVLAKVTEQGVGSTITEETIGTALKIYTNLARRTAQGAEVITILNKADSEKQIHLARRIARLVLDGTEGKILVASLKGSDPVQEVVR